jgi:hypothetical protein
MGTCNKNDCAKPTQRRKEKKEKKKGKVKKTPLGVPFYKI